MIAGVCSMPVLTTSTGMSDSTVIQLLDDKRGRQTVDGAETPRVFWAVRAVSTLAA